MKMSNIYIYLNYLNPLKKHILMDYIKSSYYENIAEYNLRNQMIFKDFKDLENSIGINYQKLYIKYKAVKNSKVFDNRNTMIELIEDSSKYKINSMILNPNKSKKEIDLCNSFKYFRSFLMVKNLTLASISSVILIKFPFVFIPFLFIGYLKKEYIYNPFNTITKISYNINKPYQITFYDFFMRKIDIEIKSLVVIANLGSTLFIEDLKTNKKYCLKSKYFHYNHFHHLSFFICGNDFIFSNDLKVKS